MRKGMFSSVRARVAGLAAVAVVGSGVYAVGGTAAHAHQDVPAGEGAPAPALVRQAARADQPNFLVVTVDDMASDDLPYLKRINALLGKQGTTYTNAVTPTPLCVPSRASLNTGQYANNHGAHSITGPHGSFSSFNDNGTLATWLKSAGYETGFVGKYLNGYGAKNARYVPPGWTDWRGSVDFDTYRYTTAKLNRNGKIFHRKGYNTDVFAHQVNQMITGHASSSKPWYLNVNYVAPHHGGPFEADDPVKTEIGKRWRFVSPHPANKFRNDFANVKMPKKPNRFRIGKRAGHRAAYGPAQRRMVQEVWQQRLETLQSVDVAVAKHLSVLKRTGQLDNTYVVFTSDNGFFAGEHRRFGKLMFYREGLEVPMLVRGPGVLAGAKNKSLVTNVDLPVTIANLAGATPTRKVDGIDIGDTFAGKSFTGRVLPIQAWQVNNGNKQMWYGVRVDDAWTYARIGKREELYDLRKDPYEMRNKARRKSQQAQRQQLARWATQYRNCAAASCPQTVTWSN